MFFRYHFKWLEGIPLSWYPGLRLYPVTLHQKTSGIAAMNGVFSRGTDKVAIACSEDRATLESDLSAAAGGRPMRRSLSGCGLLFSAHRDTSKANNSGDKSGEVFRLALHFSAAIPKYRNRLPD